MATHSSVLAWRILGTEEPVGCHLWGHTESDMTDVTQQQQQQPIIHQPYSLLVNNWRLDQVNEMREEKEMTGIEFGKEQIKLFLFTIVYVENYKTNTIL